MSNWISANLRGDTRRLAGTYLAIIMSLTLVFSGILYSISASQFDRPLPPGARVNRFDDFTRDGLQELFEQRAQEARNELLLSLLLLNLAVLIGGAFFSYFLARKTLEPIESAMEGQSQFVSDASHELRTPLAALQVTNEVALRKKGLTLADAKELIGYNLAETIKLRDLSESLLGLAKQDTADTSTTEVSVPEVIFDVIETLAPLAKNKNITIDHEVPALVITANHTAVTQILRVFIDNAIKYSAENSVIKISAEQQASGAVISVHDEGPGIAGEHHQKIFDRFYRLDESRSSRNTVGAGLGLAIAKTIADRHGYGIDISSAIGQGSTFSLNIK